MEEDRAILVGERGRWICTRGRTVHLLFFFFVFVLLCGNFSISWFLDLLADPLSSLEVCT